MCDKYIFTITQEFMTNNSGHSLYNTGSVIDNFVFNKLKFHKNAIKKNCTSKQWDTYKKGSNMYELIFTSGYRYPSLSVYSPVSRSYFKHWEILHDFEAEFTFMKNKHVNAAFLAEGPGGFIEAFVRKRSVFSTKTSTDILHGVTLISSNRMVPSWKLSKSLLQENNIKLLYGVDFTGTMYNINNIIDYVDKIGSGQCDYVTADGGFDFGDEYNQELMSLRLVLCEVFTCMLIQKRGGAFVLKIYDINLPETKAILAILQQSYTTISFVKPCTSRAANSEKYIVCNDFIECKYINVLEQCVRRGTLLTLSAAVSCSMDNTFDMMVFNDMVSFYNIQFMMKQIIHINTTLLKRDSVSREDIKKQLECALKWCHKYNVKINPVNIKYYKHILEYKK